MKKVKVIYVDASIKPQNNWKGTPQQFNGDDTARILQVTIDEQEIEGYEFMESQVVTKSMGLSSGLILFFKLVEPQT